MKSLAPLVTLLFALLSLTPSIASADEAPVPIHLSVITSDGALFDGDITVSACADTEFGSSTSVNALCAIAQTASTSGWTTDLIWYSFGPFLNAINSYTSDFANQRSWSYYTDGTSGMTSIAVHTLHAGEKLLFTYGISPLRIMVASSSPLIGTSTIIQAQYYDISSAYDWVNATDTVFTINGVEMTSDAFGALVYIPTTETPVTITAQKTGFITSDAVTLMPYTATLPPAPAPSTLIHLDIEAYDQTLYDADVAVEACADTESGTTTSINAFCALKQVASTSGWTIGTTWYAGFGLFLDSINSYMPDATSSRYWGYYTNGEIGMDALNVHQLMAGEHLLLTYGLNPLRIIASSTSPIVGATTTLATEYFDPVLFRWVPATSTIYTLGTMSYISDQYGKFAFTPTTTDELVAVATGAGFVKSLPVTLTPVLEVPPTPSVTPQVGGTSPDITRTIDVQKALNYLRTVQSVDGSFGSALYTDWVAIGLAHAHGADDLRSAITAYLKQNTDSGASLTDLERRVMALEALGVNPRTGTSRDYITAMLASFDGTQWGDKNEVNDDIFALIPLLHAGYSANDELIQKTVTAILTAQSSTGSWGSIDLTGAGIIALAPVSSLPQVSDAIMKATAYLHTAQSLDGGFGSSFATSWVLGAIFAMPSESVVTNWTKNGKNPQDYLSLLQQSDGGLESTTLDQQSRIWATAYAMPTAGGYNWNTLLTAFPTAGVVSSVGTSGSDGEVLGTASTTASSTLASSSPKYVIIPFVLASTTRPIFSSTTATTSVTATATKTKPVVAQKKSSSVKKPVVSANQLVSAVIVSSSTEVSVLSSSWTHVITAPFKRLFLAVHSWFD